MLFFLGKLKKVKGRKLSKVKLFGETSIHKTRVPFYLVQLHESRQSSGSGSSKGRQVGLPGSTTHANQVLSGYFSLSVVCLGGCGGQVSHSQVWKRVRITPPDITHTIQLLEIDVGRGLT